MRYTVPITAVDSISPAIEHTKQQLFRRFSLGQWTRLAFVGLLAGELGSGGCNRSNFQIPGHPVPHGPFPGIGIDPALIAGFIASAIVAGFAIGIILMYVSSVMRFILFDSVVQRECHIRQGWSRRLGPGWRYFVFKLLYAVLSLAGIAIVVGIPLAFAFAKGWLRAPKEHLPPLILGGAILLAILLLFALITAVILVLTKDFVIPQMALENVDVLEGWRRLWSMMQAEMGAYVSYIVMKIVLAIVAAILIGIATALLALIIAVPSVALALIAVITGKSAGLTWNVYTITLAVVIGCILLAIFFFIVSLIYVPAIVFFPAYSLYFFAGRYPQLSAVLYAAPPLPRAPPGTVPVL
jgi:MFS family permease